MRDIDIRNTLKTTRLKRFFGDGQSRVIDELSLCVGDARIDLAVVNGHLHGYEIKSEADTLSRLPGQVETYSRVFDYLTVCAGQKHIDSVVRLVPEWCGVLLVSEMRSSVLLMEVQRAQRNQQTDKLSVAQLLWRDEAIRGLNHFGIVKGIASKPKGHLWRMLADVAPEKELSRYVRETLKARANWRSE